MLLAVKKTGSIFNGLPVFVTTGSGAAAALVGRRMASKIGPDLDYLQLYVAKVHAGTIQNSRVAKLLKPEKYPYITIANGELALTKEVIPLRQSDEGEKATRGYAGIKKITVVNSKGKVLFSGPSDQFKKSSPGLTVIEED